MSIPKPDPSAASFERIRRSAKQLLRDCRRGDVPSLARVRALLPRLAELDDSSLAEQLKLADVQHALAREAGLENWAALKRSVESAEPYIHQIARFMRALGEGDGEEMRDVLERFPELARSGLHAACAACDLEAVEAWLARDASQATVGIGPAGAWTPLVCLAQSPLFGIDAAHAAASVAIGERLLALGADANTSTAQPDQPAVRLSVLYRASERGNAGLVRLLLEHGAEPNDGESMYHAAERDHREVMELLLAHGAEISATHAPWGNTVLYFLAGYQDGQPMAASAMEGMRWLLEHGADPNVASDACQETPLHRMAAMGRAGAAIQTLLEHGADVTRARADGRTAYELALRAGHTEIAELLRPYGAAGELRPLDSFMAACAAGDEASARRLLDSDRGLLDALLSAQPDILAHAAGHGRSDAVQTLIALGLDVARESGDGGTPLHWAAWNGRVETVRLLLEHRAPVNVRDTRFGSSPLAWAAHGSENCRSADDDYIAVIDLLLAVGVDRKMTYNHGNAPPEALCSDAVAVHLRERKFAPDEEETPRES